MSKPPWPTSSTKISSTNPEGERPLFLFFGGKGGVGKTTCAAAYAIAAARSGLRVLAVSTDPAHSLGDALGVRLSSRPTVVAAGRPAGRGSVARFRAVELDAPRAFARWLSAHRQPLGDIVEHGTWLDREDVEALLDLSLPGVDELVGVSEIVRLTEAGHYDAVVIDTAPTGHTLRLLGAPDAVQAVAAVLEALQREHRLIREQLARVDRPEAADRLIARIADEARGTAELLRDPARSALHWVMLPERLSLAETRDALGALQAARIPVRSIIVNRVIPGGPPCPTCDGRRAEEGKIVAEVARTIGKSRPVRMVSAELREPRGVAPLAAIGKGLMERRTIRPVGRARRPERTTTGGPGPLRSTSAGSQRILDIFRDVRLLFFGGKGGVGKTTAAAAAALWIAREDPSRRVLLLSTDPAHSLGDVFDAPIGDRPARVATGPPNLRVRELDAAAALAARRVELEAGLNEIVSSFSRVTESGAGRGVSELLDLAPPGIDELFGLVSVAELLLPTPERAGVKPRARAAETRADLVVVDTAPTGHALRLLEMPDVAREWVQLVMRVLLKYRHLVRPGQLAAELLDLSKAIGALQSLMRDPDSTRFVVVTRAAEVPRLETERLLNRLGRLRLAVPAVLVNAMTLTPGRCARCRVTAAAEQRQLALIGRACRRRGRRACAIIQSPLVVPPPRGAAALERWTRAWTA